MQPQTHIDGVPVATLVADLRLAPLRLLREDPGGPLPRAARRLRAALPKVRIAWSYKTNYLDAICKVFHREGAYAEVVSEFEWEKARQPRRAWGPHPLQRALQAEATLRRVLPEGTIVHLDNFDELARGAPRRRARELGRKVACASTSRRRRRPRLEPLRLQPRERPGHGRRHAPRLRGAPGARRAALPPRHLHPRPRRLPRAGQEARRASPTSSARARPRLSFIDIGGGFASPQHAQGPVPPRRAGLPGLRALRRGDREGLSALDYPPSESPPWCWRRPRPRRRRRLS
jgi:diaminopimelate decarboxylase